jgi:hypothetical protein
MRTTVRIPDELLQQAKAQAAQEGLRLRDLIERGLRLALSERRQSKSRRVTFPLLRSRKPGVLTSAAVSSAEEAVARQEDSDRAYAM